MRIADKMAYEQVNSNIGKNRSQMSELQNQAATQKRLTKPSIDPVAAARVLSNKIDLQGNRQYAKSLNYAKSFLEYTDQSLSEITENLVRAKELALAQASDTSANEQTRQVVATEVEQLFNQLVQIGNRKLGERFIFGGYKTNDAPFMPDGDYKGDKGEILIHTDKESFVAMNIPGSKVFLGEGLRGDGISHLTSEQPKTIEELKQQQIEAKQLEQKSQAQLRGPASVGDEGAKVETKSGMNLFKVMKQFEIALRTNDKEGVQDILNELDEAISQVVLARATVGSRGMALDNLAQSLEKAKVDSQIMVSQLEDADVFQTVSDINKTQSTLQATLESSGKLIQPSLLQFLR